MRVGVVGINHKLADLHLREELAKVCHRHFRPDNPFLEESCVLLSTCNRTEIYFCSPDLAATHSYLLGILRGELGMEFEHKLYSYFGVDCFLHLARVTSGLDSAITAETEIQGQVNRAYHARTGSITLPFDLHYLFQKSLKIGKLIRSDFKIGQGMPDIEHVVLSAGLHLFGDPWRKRVLFVGASSINQKICCFLQHRGLKDITLTNRSDARASTFAERHAIRTLPWNQLDRWTDYDWVIVGTKATEPILYPAISSRRQLVIDLSVPRNVDPRIGRLESTTLLNIDQIHRNMKHRRRQLKDQMLVAELRITAEVRKLASLFQDKRERSASKTIPIALQDSVFGKEKGLAIEQS